MLEEAMDEEMTRTLEAFRGIQEKTQMIRKRKRRRMQELEEYEIRSPFESTKKGMGAGVKQSEEDNECTGRQNGDRSHR